MTFLIFMLLLGFFILALITRTISHKRICAVCGAVSLTWLSLLAARFIGYEVDDRMIGILMGGSAVGMMYFLSSKLSERYEILKFPFLVTAFWLIYRVLTGTLPDASDGFSIIGMWLLFGMIYLLYASDRLKVLGKKIIECCKNW